MDFSNNIEDILNRYGYIVFDFDRTIVQLDVDRNSMKRELSEYIKKKYNHDIVFSPLNKTLFICKNIFGENCYLNLLKIVKKYELLWWYIYLKNSILDFIKTSKNKHIWLFTMNMFATIEKFINIELWWKNPFDIIITKENCLNIKPSGDDINYILKKWGKDASDVIYIGDSVDDKKSWEEAWVNVFIL